MGPECNYKQTKWAAPFLLQFFLGFPTGCGAFMVGREDYGGAELGLFWGGLILSCAVGAWNKDCGLCTYTVVTLTNLALWITILVKIGNQDFTDAQGAPLGEFS
jgi:hypothetical protein